MKRMILVAAMFVSVAAFANEEVKVSQKILSAFKSDFNLAENIKWSMEDEYYKVSFLNMNMPVEAYYDADGELLGSVRRLSFEQLPLAVIHEYKKKYDNALLLSVVEITNSNGTSYRIWLEKENKLFKLSANSSGAIDILERKKK